MKNAALLLCSAMFALLIGEGIVRIGSLGSAHLTRGPLHQYDADAGWTCKSDLDARYVLPHSFDVRLLCNSRGLRGEDLPYAKEPGTNRIVVLGGSIMWGYGVENDEMFSSQLAAHLPQSESVNFGANGYSTVQELVRFENEGIKYAPDWTVLAFTRNDLEDNFDDKNGGRPVAEVTAEGTFRVVNSPVRRQWKSPVKQWFRHHSRLFGFGEYSLELTKAIGKERRRRQARERATKSPSERRADKPGKMEFSPLDLFVPPSSEMDLAWEAVRFLLERVNDLTRENGGCMLVTANAGKFTMYRDDFEDRFGKDMEIDWDRPARRLAEISASLGIDYIDLNPVFRREPDPMALFLPNNDHWSAQGHALAARTVAEMLDPNGGDRATSWHRRAQPGECLAGGRDDGLPAAPRGGG